ncbi:MAG: hypothetical protein K8S94_09255 [Planctomycetia bacterium]|nr:hypothetical protein [Planctomycetia bacterium]
MKRLLAKLLCCTVALSMCEPLNAQTLDGFRRMEWGDPPTPDFIVAEKPALTKHAEKLIRPQAVPYTRKEDKLSVGPLQVESIHYWFFENKLRAVTLTLTAKNRSGDWHEVLSKAYGNDHQVPMSIDARGFGGFWAPNDSVTWVYLDRPLLNDEPATQVTILDSRDFKRQQQEKAEQEGAKLKGVEKDF